MSKMDNLRAMREARYEQSKAAGAKAKATTRRTPPASGASTSTAEPTATPTKVPSTPADTPQTEDQLCGHRNMSGRTCTREHGHAAKSHRYS